MPDVRTERVDAVRQQISTGNYDTEEKLGIAIERLIADVQETP